jgi:anti-sigma regulatory factor (Ser/Thr protein kinase)
LKHWLSKTNFTADFENLEPIRCLIQEESQALGVSDDDIYDLMLAVTELVTNTIEHGYQMEEGWIEIEIGYENAALVIILRDGAPKFDPTTVPIPDVKLPLKKRHMRGLGVFITRHMVDEFTYQLDEAGNNQVTLVRYNILGKNKEDADGNDSQ